MLLCALLPLGPRNNRSGILVNKMFNLVCAENSIGAVIGALEKIHDSLLLLNFKSKFKLFQIVFVCGELKVVPSTVAVRDTRAERLLLFFSRNA